MSVYDYKNQGSVESAYLGTSDWCSEVDSPMTHKNRVQKIYRAGRRIKKILKIQANFL
jgi:hypothetical protein